MSSRKRANKNPKGSGYDYWGRRALSGICGYGRVVKKITTQKERARAKQALLKNPEILKNKEPI